MSKNPREISVIVNHNSNPYRIIKILRHSKTGFAVFVPEHFPSGWLGKYRINYGQRVSYVPLEAFPVRFSTTRPVKLSYHPDGFVQFSTVTQPILSGVSTLGTPKGLGIHTQPLHNPIRTGPVVGVTIWGLHTFSPYQHGGKNAEFEFQESDIPGWPGHPTGTQLAYLLELHLFPAHHSADLYTASDGSLRMTVPMPNFKVHGKLFTFRVLPFRLTGGTLAGLYVRRMPVSFPTEAGFILGGPTRIILPEIVGFKIGEGLIASYPALGDTSGLASLDYNPPSPDALLGSKPEGES